MDDTHVAVFKGNVLAHRRQTGDVFEGFKFGDANVQFDDTLILIEPEAAEKYQSSLPADLKPSAGIAGSVTQTTTGLYDQPTPVNPLTAAPGATPASGTPKAKSFYGSVEVNPTTAKMRLVQLAEEIISNLTSDPQAALKITVEITADFPNGATDQIKRAVSENAKSLGFKTATRE